MFLINMLNWICRVDTRGCKKGYPKRIGEMEWKMSRKMRENSANCKLFPYIHCFAYNSEQTITMGV